MRFYIGIFILGLCLGALGFYLAFWPKYVETEKTVITEKIEWIKKDTTIYNYKDSLRIMQVDAKPSANPAEYDSTRTYRGRNKFDYGIIDWKAKTDGRLTELIFEPQLTIPIRTIETYTKSTKVPRGAPKRLYGLAGFNSNMGWETGLVYTNDRVLLGYDYDIVFNRHSLKVGIVLIGK